MSITVNERAISDAEIEREAAFHRGAPEPIAAASCALAIRALLLDRALALGIADDEALIDGARCDEAIERLLQREAPVPQPTRDECRRYYDAHPEEFRGGDLVEAAHILLAVTPDAPLEAIRRQAESVLKQALAAPHDFGALARQFSNCPSAAQDGHLGQLTRGDAVPEFERALFDTEATGVLPHLVRTRYGFHVVCVARRLPARVVDFEAAHPHLAARLSARVQAKATEQYVRVLAARARIAGVDLDAAQSALLQ